ncbi:UDP-3-O-(3-hydroxymyristoyl)glucosamine N-acyltransferase [Ferrovibrio sp.]|uniref:UDP-3-O-(3-hydroxymyristoyl)glucosamine N-acyltransferase n=1 Tax=Ferrovibrio sp. TaxID=1917215 RepID=UPI0025BB33A2|nr:UDP-3-O-(3-hydroxymyristoyl)glucosamine N-acyltransferase [Ferrovibrio sp.]MBX3454806.1 UDP-3-O-(3-hydroxymyristoyl)glucosamine N-acyltransferase [Ferrovibrio sp.]
MADPRFFDNAGPFTLGMVAERIGAKLADPAQSGLQLRDVAPLDRAGDGELTFLDNPKYADKLNASQAAACILAEKFRSRAPAGMALLITPQPYHAYARAAQLFYPLPRSPAGMHDTASIDPTARLGEGVSVAERAVIEAGAEIGAGCSIGPGAVIGRNVVLGEACRIGANVSLSHCLLGARVTLHPGVRIGQDGFGFAPHPAGHIKVPQLGRVLIGDDCDIGANSCIDRGSGPDTVIGPGCWIDNLVQIGHNVTMGRGCIVIAQVGIAGSTRLEDFVVVAAQAGVAGHLTIGSGAQIGAQAGVMTDIPAGQRHVGSPSSPARDYFRQVATLRRLSKTRGTDNE